MDRWCVKVHGRIQLGITGHLCDVGYVLSGIPRARGDVFWLYFDGKIVRACEDAKYAGPDGAFQSWYMGDGIVTYAKIDAADIFDLPRFEKQGVSMMEQIRPIQAEANHDEHQGLHNELRGRMKEADIKKKQYATPQDLLNLQELLLNTIETALPKREHIEPLPRVDPAAAYNKATDLWQAIDKINEIIERINNGPK